MKTLFKTVLKTFSVHGFYPGSGLKIIDFYSDLTLLCVCREVKVRGRKVGREEKVRGRKVGRKEEVRARRTLNIHLSLLNHRSQLQYSADLQFTFIHKL